MKCLLPILILLCDTAAQDRKITVQNLAPFARREWVRTVVPFPRGAVEDLPDLHVGKAPTVWQPIGARWGDGSLRQALCLFRVKMKALSEMLLPLRKGPGPALAKHPIVDPVRAGSVKVSMRIIS